MCVCLSVCVSAFVSCLRAACLSYCVCLSVCVSAFVPCLGAACLS